VSALICTQSIAQVTCITPKHATWLITACEALHVSTSEPCTSVCQCDMLNNWVASYRVACNLRALCNLDHCGLTALSPSIWTLSPSSIKALAGCLTAQRGTPDLSPTHVRTSTCYACHSTPVERVCTLAISIRVAMKCVDMHSFCIFCAQGGCGSGLAADSSMPRHQHMHAEHGEFHTQSAGQITKIPRFLRATSWSNRAPI